MVYLDYSATTPVHSDVLNSFVDATLKYPGNPNSLHKMGVEAKILIEKSTQQIKQLLNVENYDVIYTSGSSESNNLAIKGIAYTYRNRGKHLITTDLEHSSVYGPIDFLIKQGYEVSFVNLLEDGTVDFNHLKSLMRDDTILVSVNAVNSELGIIQPIETIGRFLQNYPKCYFHVDMTQVIGKKKINCEEIDLISFSAHKFYGLKGIGALLKKEKVELEPSIHGGKSTTKYRSGTPALPLIVSMAKALRLALLDLDTKYKEVEAKNSFLRKKLEGYENVKVNSPENALPHILNISILEVKPETMLHALEEKEVFVSTQSACSSHHAESKAVLALTHDTRRAQSSIRISLSHLTTNQELECFLSAFDECYKRLTGLIERK